MEELMTNNRRQLDEIIRDNLKSHVRKIDAEAHYPMEYMITLGKEGYFSSIEKQLGVVKSDGVRLVEETAKTCMTTAFNIWCHLAALTYARHSENDSLKRMLLPGLENGTLLGGTGLSNPMKFYAGMDKLYLKAVASGDGYILSGQLPMVSNLGDDHWFGVVAAAGDQRIMVFVSCKAEGLKMEEKLGFLGLNGSATYSCSFNQVYIPAEQVISDRADEFIEHIRAIFVLYQIPLGLGIVDSSMESMRQVREKQAGCNRYLPVQPEHLEPELDRLRQETYRLASLPTNTKEVWGAMLNVRLDTAYLALQAVQASMLHQGSSGYMYHSAPSRRLREAYFFANLTPTVRHLEKLRASI